MAWESRKGIGKAKAYLELNLHRDTKNNKGFFRYVGKQRKMKETVSPTVGEMGDLATISTKMAQVLNNFFALVFTGKHSSHTTEFTESKGRTGRMKCYPCRRRSSSRSHKELEGVQVHRT